LSGVFSDKIFDDSTCTANAPVRCDHAQVLLPIKFKFLRFTKRIVPPGALDGKEEGAVIFGNSKRLPVDWPEDPEQIAQEGWLALDTTVPGGMEVGTGFATTSRSDGSVSSTRSASLQLGDAEGSSPAISSSPQDAALTDVTIPDSSKNKSEGSTF
jgi:hypothetical protein